jgi:hypothetical protein
MSVCILHFCRFLYPNILVIYIISNIGWLGGWLVGWLVGWVGGWLVGWLVGWLLGWPSFGSHT